MNSTQHNELINEDLYGCDKVKLECADLIIEKIVKETGVVGSAFDLGCGTGIYVQTLIDNAIPTIGIDINNTISEDMLNTDAFNLRRHDLGKPVCDLYEPRDLVISFETGEHIPNHEGLVFLQNVNDMAKKWIVMTCSPDKGKYHLNPQPMKYWVDGIEMYGDFKHKPYESLLMMEYFRKNISLELGGFIWFKRDLMIFEAES